MVPVGAIVPNPNALAFWTVLAQLGPSLSQQKQLAMRPQASIFWDEDVVEAKGN